MSTGWTQERIATLRSLRNQGLSVNQCASELGVTRGSVLGKMSRLGLCNSGGKVRHTPHRTKPRQHAIKETLPPVDEIPLSSRRLNLSELTICSCRWPYGDPLRGGFFFCGSSQANLETGRPYCPLHNAMAYAVAPST